LIVTRVIPAGTVRLAPCAVSWLQVMVLPLSVQPAGAAAEVWMAAEYQGDDETAEEISQLLYHLQVLMIASGLTLDDVYAHL
jgi:hypothetical protein